MKTLTNFKTWSARAKNATAALLFLAAYTISMVSPFVTTKAYAAEVPTQTETTTTIQSSGTDTTGDTPSGDEVPAVPTDTAPSDTTDAGGSTGTPPVGFAMMSQSYDPGCYPYQNCNPKGSITIIKDAKPNSPQDFSFTTTGNGLSNFALDDDSNQTLSNTKTFNNLSAGAYSVTEGDTTGWDFGNLSCTGGGTIINGKKVTINLTAGANVTCTFTNLQRGKIIVNKVTDPAGNVTMFPIGINPGTGVTGATGRNLSTSSPVTYEVTQGTTYDIAEDLSNLPSWKTTGNTCNYLKIDDRTQLENGVPTLHCTITNTKLTKLTLIKNVINDNGGTRTASEWTLTASGQTSISGKGGATSGPDFKAGSYTLSETGPTDYTKGSWSCIGATVSNSQVRINTGDDVTCKITNDDIAPSLTLKKYVSNHYGGELKASAWTLTAAGANSGFTLSGAGGATSGADFKADSYKLSENGPSGYDASNWDCGYKQIVNGTITVKLGESVTCSITNSDRPITISGHKKIANTDLTWVTQGLNPVNGWTIYLDQNHNGKLDNNEKWTKTDANGYYSFTGLNSNTTYYVNEVITSLGNGWAQISAPSPVFVSFSGGVSTNNDFKNIAQGTITVIKNVDDGFGHVTKNVKTWTWNYDGKQQDGQHLATGSNNTQTVPSGTYKVSEDQKPGYHVVASSCSTNYNPYDQYSYSGDKHDGDNYNKVDEEQSVKVGLGQNVTCDFTNKRDTGTITVHKKIGNKLDPKGWTWWLGDSEGSNSMGDTEKVASGSYWFGENQQNGYSFESLKCKDGRESVWVSQSITAKINVGKDDHIECTFTNSRDTGNVTIIKDARPDSSQGFVFTIEPVSTTIDQEGSYSSDTVLTESIVGKQDTNQSNWYQHSNNSGDGNPTTTFTLTDDGDSKNSQSTALPTGKYRVSEDSVKGWDLSSISCGETKVDVEDGVLYLNVIKGVNIVCTFVNTKRAQLTIIKDVQPGISSKAFSFTTNAVTGELGADTTFSLTDDGTGLTNSKSFENLLPGTYTVTEQSDSAWKLNDIVCSGPGVTMTREGAKLMVTLAAGAVVSCTFVNSFIPQVLAETTTLPMLENTGASAVVTTVIALVTIATALWATLYRRKMTTEAVKVTKY